MFKYTVTLLALLSSFLHMPLASASLYNYGYDATGSMGSNLGYDSAIYGSGGGTFDTDTGVLSVTLDLHIEVETYLGWVLDDITFITNINGPENMAVYYESCTKSSGFIDCVDEYTGTPEDPITDGFWLTHLSGDSNGPIQLEVNWYSYATGIGEILNTIQLTGGCATEDGNCEYDNVPTIFSTYTVPVPAAAWLFGSALIGLAGIKRKK